MNKEDVEMLEFKKKLVYLLSDPQVRAMIKQAANEKEDWDYDD